MDPIYCQSVGQNVCSYPIVLAAYYWTLKTRRVKLVSVWIDETYTGHLHPFIIPIFQTGDMKPGLETLGYLPGSPLNSTFRRYC